MLKTLFLLLVVLACTNAIFFGNDDDDDDDDDDDMQFSNSFFSVTKLKCFGAVISEDDDEDLDQETEFDICVAGLVTGLIGILVAYPFLLQNIGGQQGYVSAYNRNSVAYSPEQQQYPVEFENPAEQGNFIQKRRGSTLSKLSSLVSRFSSGFQKSLNKIAQPAAQQAQES